MCVLACLVYAFEWQRENAMNAMLNHRSTLYTEEMKTQI